MIFNPLTTIRLVVVAAVLAAGWFAYGWGSQIISNYGAMAARIQKLDRDIALRDSREQSLRRLIERRDNAINASKCKAQINEWLKNNSTPEPFDPSKVLNPNGG